MSVFGDICRLAKANVSTGDSFSDYQARRDALMLADNDPIDSASAAEKIGISRSDWMSKRWREFLDEARK